MDKYSLAFSVSNLGPKSFQKLLNKFGSSDRAWNATELAYKELGILGLTFNKFEKFRREFDYVQYTGHLTKSKVEFIGFEDKRYPESLKKIENPPIGLFCKGNLTLLRHPGLDPGSSSLRIGVVGTRRITQYGRDVTNMLVSDLVKNGTIIVSGLALGVDGLAHRVTLENHGYAIAVLACGVDCCLPSENYSLYSQILKQNGLIISEYPLSQPPNKGTFLARNRIVAAISDGLLITEAAEGSGSLVTSEYALQYGKKVFAVPGQINSQMSKGSIGLIKKGGILVQDAQDILSEFGTKNFKSKTSKNQFKNLSKEEKKIVMLIENEGLTIDEIARESKLPISKIFILISNLELSGIVKNNAGKLLVVK
jgi:DNA processing protein